MEKRGGRGGRAEFGRGRRSSRTALGVVHAPPVLPRVAACVLSLVPRLCACVPRTAVAARGQRPRLVAAHPQTRTRTRRPRRGRRGAVSRATHAAAGRGCHVMGGAAGVGEGVPSQGEPLGVFVLALLRARSARADDAGRHTDRRQQTHSEVGTQRGLYCNAGASVSQRDMWRRAHAPRAFDFHVPHGTHYFRPHVVRTPPLVHSKTPRQPSFTQNVPARGVQPNVMPGWQVLSAAA